MSEKRCVFCGSPDVNLWKSWNEVGEWTCDDCTPSLAIGEYLDTEEDL